MGKIVKIKQGSICDKGIALIGVSVGPEYYKGEYFEAIVDFVLNKFRRGNIYIMLADSLNAYNYMLYNDNLTIKDNLNEARDSAIQESEQWLEQNKFAFERLTDAGVKVINLSSG